MPLCRTKLEPLHLQLCSAAAWVARAPAGVYIASNMSTRCFVFPARICFSVLYLSRPVATIFLYSASLSVTAVCSFAASNSALRVCVIATISHNTRVTSVQIKILNNMPKRKSGKKSFFSKHS